MATEGSVTGAVPAATAATLSHAQLVLQRKQRDTTTYIRTALLIWSCCIVTFMCLHGPGLGSVAAAVANAHLPEEYTMHLATLVAFLVVIWTDVTSMVATKTQVKPVHAAYKYG